MQRRRPLVNWNRDRGRAWRLRPWPPGSALLATLVLWPLATAGAADDDARCSLVVEVEPRGAEIRLDGRSVGTTRVALALACGGHRIEVSRAGHRGFRADLVLEPGPPRLLKARLEPAPAPEPHPSSSPAAPTPSTTSRATEPAGDLCPITATDADEPSPRRADFTDWLTDFRRQAAECGITEPTLASALDGLTPDVAIARLDRKQAEYNSTFSGYLRNRISNGLVAQGQARLERWGGLLAGLEQRFGIPPEVIVALWGLESAFGQVTGETPTIRALATLAHDGRRRDFYQRELLAALRLIDAGHNRAGMRGSWAGAMGQPQFMPSTFQAHAIDGDGDGRLDIWGSVPDALSSAANYLAAIHWRRGQSWGREVRLPAGFDAYQARLPLRLTDADWAAQGVSAANGGALTDLGLAGSIVLPAGVDGPAFLVYDNFRVITEWNRSVFYGLTVGILSDRLAGRPGPLRRVPGGEQRLRRNEVMELQTALNRLGYPVGTPDGMIGMQTRQALRSFQRDQDLVPDAYPSRATIAALRGESASAAKPDLTRDDVLALQRGLNARGFEAGTEDGLWGGQTRRAFDDWLRDQGLPPGSEPTPELIQRVARPALDIEPDRHLDPRLLVPRGLDGGRR